MTTAVESEFDPLALATLIRSLRVARRWTTRDLARAASLSQAYVIVLETGARSDGTAAVPTVQVMAQLAAAFGLDTAGFVRRSLRPVSRHVLLTTDGTVSPLDAAVRAGSRAGSRPPTTWLTAGSDPSTTFDIDLRPGRRSGYDRASVSTRLETELERVSARVEGRHLGLLFAETSMVISHGVDQHEILDFEQDWSSVVCGACWRVGTHPVWNVCVYELSVLSSLSDRAGSIRHLIESHDTVWFAGSQGVTTGPAAVRRTLTALQLDPTVGAITTQAAPRGAGRARRANAR